MIKPALVVAVGLCLVSCGKSASPAKAVDYEVRISASDRPMEIFGCPVCSPSQSIDAAGYLNWQETRALPRTYAIAVGGVRSECPALTRAVRARSGAVQWNLVADKAGHCVMDTR